MRIILCLLFFSFSVALAFEPSKASPLYVHLVPHSHDDVGWLQTVDGYYQSQVKHIISSVTSALSANPERKFVQVEQAFFHMWWTDPATTDAQRDQYKKLVKNGQIEFVIGGWVMQDEACTTYGADLDQMTQGHQFLVNTFGVRPTKGWQLDPFGASSVTPTLNKLCGFNAHLIDRISNKADYENNKRLEFLWKGSPSLGSQAEIFTNIMDAHYGTWYEAFSFAKDPVTDQNVATLGQKFLTMANQMAAHILTPHMLAAWGDDFQFQNATADFHSMDKLLAWLKTQESKTNVIVRYSTVSEYFAAEMATPNIKWPVNEGGDFFPYLAGKYWTGYFTSRTELKGYVRNGEATARAVEPLYVLSRATKKVNPSTYTLLDSLRMANANAQHHDGVTGTSEPAVVEMYKNDIINGIKAASTVAASVLASDIQKGTQTATLTPGTDAITNIKPSQTLAVVIYNSLGWTRNDIVSVNVLRKDLTVADEIGKPVEVQFAPSTTQTNQYVMYFSASIGPMGYRTFFVKSPATSPLPFEEEEVEAKAPMADTVLQNDALKVTISGSTGLISNVVNRKSNVTLNLRQNIEQYTSKNSGAYAFGPAGPSAPLSSKPPKVTVNQGSLVDTVHQVFPVEGSSTSYATQTIRLFHGPTETQNYIELDYNLGPLPSHRELVATFTSSIANNGTFATDANGFEFMKREYNSKVPLEGNYYPMVYASYIRDKSAQLSVVSERSHGACGSANGKLEVMIHRNPDMGDGFGPGLTDTSVVSPSLRLIVDNPTDSQRAVHQQTYLKNFPLTFFTSPVPNSDITTWTKDFSTSNQFLDADLPPNIHLLTLNALDATSNRAILRLTHLYASGEDSTYSASVKIEFDKLFKSNKLASVLETTATANNVINKDVLTDVTITPKQIRTFVVEFA